MSERTYYSHEAKLRAQREKAVLVALALSAGGAIGALIMLLLAPQNGDKTRQWVVQYVTEAVEKGQQTAKTISEQVKENIHAT